MRVLVLSVLLLLAFGLMAQAKEPQRPRCDNCGMFTDVSTTNVKATLKIGGKEAEYNFVCLDCVHEYMEGKAGGKAKLVSLKVLDYDTFGTKTPAFIDGKTAWYLVGTSVLKGSMEPYIAAFASKAAATKAKKTLGGELKNWSDTWAGITAAEEGTASGSAGEDEYVCPMCAGVSSDKPGDCPHCGMKLVQKTEEK
jgi:hypothetical protein